MIWLADGKQMREIDRRAIDEIGIPGQLLMEAAASFTGQVAVEEFDLCGQIVVVVGGGNNGGDGWGVARHLAARHLPVRVVTAVDPTELSGDAALEYQVYEKYGLPWERYTGPSQFQDCCLVIDALLGTGVRGKPRGVAGEIIVGINASPAPVLAVDIPSGLLAHCAPPAGPVVQAQVTATFGLAKTGLFTPQGRQAAGKVRVDPIGLPRELLKTGLVLNDVTHAALGLPQRSMNSHKGSFGHGLLIAGSQGMSGAALLAGNSALLAGIGLLTLACPQSINQVVENNLWEALSLPLPTTESGTFAEIEDIELDRYSAAAVGPGCRVCPGTKSLVQALMQSSLPLAVDADGLNAMAPGFPRRQYPTVISPHPGEMARLLGKNIQEVTDAPLAAAQRAAEDWDCTVILKGSTTFIAGQQGAALNITGTNGLATGGSGDVLTGLVLGLLAQGTDAFAAACTATWLLGRASELAAKELGTVSQLPRAVQGHLSAAIRQLEEIST